MAANGAGKRQVRHEPPPIPDTLPSFEEALGELDRAVDALEGGQLELDDALALFERGMRLARACQEALDRAELRVRLLVEAEDDAGGPRDIPFDADAE